MDKKKKGYITLAEYLAYIDVMIYGTEEERLLQSFSMLDVRGQGEISFEDFRKIVHQFAQMWSAALS